MIERSCDFEFVTYRRQNTELESIAIAPDADLPNLAVDMSSVATVYPAGPDPMMTTFSASDP